MNDKVKNIIETYRKTWTSDSSALRDLRFQTETRRAGNYLADEFQVDSIRMLPGCPKSLENLRAKLIEKFGILALLALRNEIGNWNDVIPSKNLKESLLMKLNIKLSNVEFLQVLIYILATSNFLMNLSYVYNADFIVRFPEYFGRSRFSQHA